MELKFEKFANKILNEKYDAYDEADVMFRINREDGKMYSKSILHAHKNQAYAQGWCDDRETALKKAGIMRSKFNPDKYVRKQGEKWVEVFPFKHV
jgi:hypothetical protein